MRSMLTTFINALMSAEADAVCGAEYGARSETRTNSRNGYLHRAFLGAVICCTPYRHTVKQLSVSEVVSKISILSSAQPFAGRKAQADTR